MKKVLFSAVLVAAVATSIISCEKKVVKQNPAEAAVETPAVEKTICTLSDIYESDYTFLAMTLSGSTNNGDGSVGALDTKLNCNQSPGTLCDYHTDGFITVANLSPNSSIGTPYLSDGVMTVAEQQALITVIQNNCIAHKNSTYGTNYVITNYDVFYLIPLCGGCPEVTLKVNYTAAKPCR